MKKLAFILLFTTFVVSCHSQKEASKAMTAAIGETYFQNWVAGVQGGGSGTNFFIQCKKAAPKEMVLKALYFRGKKAPITKHSENLYTARRNWILPCDVNATPRCAS